MKPYKNLANNSGIRAYEILNDGIKIQFNNNATYLYDFRIPGRDHVERMKQLATAGKGLSTYISQQLDGRYADKLD
jgi:hypothetical protein